MPARETMTHESALRKFLTKVVPSKTTVVVAAPANAAASTPTQAEFNALVAVVAQLRTAAQTSGLTK
jgi:hypothetical protein